MFVSIGRLFGAVVLVCGFGLLGYTANRHAVRAAAVPAPCSQYECRTVHAGWDGNPKVVFAHFTAGSKGVVNDSYGIEMIFSDSSVEQKPRVNDGTNQIDVYPYPACTPNCGKDANKTWQAIQSVTALGAQGMVTNQNVQKQICTAGAAPAILNPVNANKNGNTPPGN